MTCGGVGTYNADYSVAGNMLFITFQLNGEPVTLWRTVAISENSGDEYLHFSIEDLNVSQMIPDAEETAIPDVQHIELVYKKQ